jgi:molybdenum cofactor biosynthesis protein B
MVDFQSRDTRRGLEDETEEEESEPEETEGGSGEGAEPGAETGTDDPSAAASEEADRSGNGSQDDSSAAADESDGASAHGETAEPDDEASGQGRDEQDESRSHGDRSGDGQDDHHGNHDGHDQHEHDDHDHHAHDLDTLGVAVVTVSSSRTLSDDPAGDTITRIMEADDDEVVTRELIPDDYDRIQATLDNLVTREDVDAIITSGGTGVTPDDVTIEAAERLFDKELPGFGELFRLLSYDEIGTKVVGTRATAGIANGIPVFCLPGSENAARLGAETIISEEAGHIAGLAKRSNES